MTDMKWLLLFYFCSFSGAFMVIGGIVLLYKQKIYIDRESNQITEIETPIGRFKTNIPALFLFALGFVPLIYPLWQISKSPDLVTIEGKLDSSVFPIDVYVVSRTHRVHSAGEFSVNVPALRGENARQYDVIFERCGRIYEDDALPGSQPRTFVVRDKTFRDPCPPAWRPSE